MASVHAGPSVLVVDDEQDFVETLVKRMERRGFKVAGVGSGQEALLLLGKEHYDVVILDVMMPGIDGIETLREIKLAWPKIQVILLSGHGGEEMGLRGMAYGAYSYLLKPVALKTIVETTYTAFEEAGVR
ncbi:DNA-binding response OmpR family regulator [Desulfomicrobium macestii]|uniref:Response regulator receiver domain-containing protein n=3 Tax=Desulfomicrobium TaxID=898 RepID=A0A8G2BZL7_DESNO|nr:response regulator [Desulfomicrobium macestii]MBE1423417.1 DNA-binding response OmpR family regulator [Desulfomicrobium macestii]SFL26339.1 Response regulator receiver domain-containing protein [Desulfomicrobium norvegicum]